MNLQGNMKIQLLILKNHLYCKIMFLYKKSIDRSALREGLSIPTEYHPLLHSLNGGALKRGETVK